MHKPKPTILSINISKGGIPKLPVSSIRVNFAGLEGDGHNHEKHYRPTQAVCIQDAERLEELCAKGYPLAPGTAGENLTVRGLNVNALPAGTVLEFSGGVVLEITRTRPTCYVMDQIHPKLKEDATDCHGMYAKVIKEGILKQGETIDVVKSLQESISNSFALWPHTGAIFCGGRSSRMGKPKASIILPSGDTLLCNAKEIRRALRLFPEDQSSQ